ncbi:DUF2627 family protein [Oceanobacillus sp. 143]|jgi:hypothetical protein|uniref:DUF2627 domain-containing protein n=1 Tax=Oceanobacillus zhaokaii TaxID=2052660 RepID=A0A345PHD5_9BACI|nr:DUF2627 family protein [Oceanobacillus zhaokaii]AXI09415.1 DUF2627 domain-containing protein [Oceanobacillus zhaokaii]QGS68848.1 DUF2627 family protein [Oceanobacillus sp. 143]
MIRIIALLLLFIPGFLTVFGIKMMRDSLFSEFYPIFFNSGIQFVIGFLFTIGGIAFLGGFVIYRDRKKEHNMKENKLEKLEKDG